MPPVVQPFPRGPEVFPVHPETAYPARDRRGAAEDRGTRESNVEFRMTNAKSMTNAEVLKNAGGQRSGLRGRVGVRPDRRPRSGFVIRPSALFWHSSFGIRHSVSFRQVRTFRMTPKWGHDLDSGEGLRPSEDLPGIQDRVPILRPV